MEFVEKVFEGRTNRVHVCAGSMDGDDLVAVGDVERLPDDAETRIERMVDHHPVERYPDGAVIATYAPGGLTVHEIRDPEDVKSDPYKYGYLLDR